MEADVSTVGARCPKFDSCSAPICPLDPDWQKRTHLAGERVCLWLREAVKPGIRDIPIMLADSIMATLPEIEASHCDVRHKLKRAAAAGSKREAAHGA